MAIFNGLLVRIAKHLQLKTSPGDGNLDPAGRLVTEWPEFPTEVYQGTESREGDGEFAALSPHHSAMAAVVDFQVQLNCAEQTQHHAS